MPSFLYINLLFFCIDKEDIGKGILRIDPNLITQLNLSINDVIKITNQNKNRTTAAFLKLGNPMDGGSKIIRIDANLRRNLGVSIDDKVVVSKINAELAKEVVFECYNPNLTIKNPNQLANKLEGTIITKDNIFSFNYKSKIIDLVVSHFFPNSEAVIIQKNTSVIIQDIISQDFNDNISLKLFKNLYSEIYNLKLKINEINDEIINLKHN